MPQNGQTRKSLGDLDGLVKEREILVTLGFSRFCRAIIDKTG